MHNAFNAVGVPLMEKCAIEMRLSLVICGSWRETAVEKPEHAGTGHGMAKLT